MRKTRFLKKVKKITGISLGRNERVLTNSRGNPISQEMHGSLADLKRTRGQNAVTPVRYRIDPKSPKSIEQQFLEQGMSPELVEKIAMERKIAQDKPKRAQ